MELEILIFRFLFIKPLSKLGMIKFSLAVLLWFSEMETNPIEAIAAKFFEMNIQSVCE